MTVNVNKQNINKIRHKQMTTEASKNKNKRKDTDTGM